MPRVWRYRRVPWSWRLRPDTLTSAGPRSTDTRCSSRAWINTPSIPSSRGRHDHASQFPGLRCFPSRTPVAHFFFTFQNWYFSQKSSQLVSRFVTAVKVAYPQRKQGCSVVTDVSQKEKKTLFLLKLFYPLRPVVTGVYTRPWSSRVRRDAIADKI